MNYITYLDLSYNNIDDTMSLAKLTELSHLDISHNKLDDLIGLENHHYLKSLNLSNNLLKVKNDDDDPSMFGPLFYYPENVIMDIDRNLISEPDFITWNLRHRANFQLEITPTISWIPAAYLGRPDYDYDEMKDVILNFPTGQRTKINNLYGALQFLQNSDYKIAFTEKRI